MEVGLRFAVNRANTVRAVAIRDAMLPNARAVVVVSRVVAMSSRIEHAVSRVLSHRSLSVYAVACSAIEEVTVVLGVGRRGTIHILRRPIPRVRWRQGCSTRPTRGLVLIPDGLVWSVSRLLNMLAALHARQTLVLCNLLLVPGGVGRMGARLNVGLNWRNKGRESLPAGLGLLSLLVLQPFLPAVQPRIVVLALVQVDI